MGDMYVVQVVAYFKKGLDKEECQNAIEALEDVLQFDLKVMGDAERGFESHTVKFLDNLQNFEPDDVLPAVKRVMHDDRVRILDYILWEMDTEEPDFRLTKTE